MYGYWDIYIYLETYGTEFNPHLLNGKTIYYNEKTIPSFYLVSSPGEQSNFHINQILQIILVGYFKTIISTINNICLY